jgi:hypothetical protein
MGVGLEHPVGLAEPGGLTLGAYRGGGVGAGDV